MKHLIESNKSTEDIIKQDIFEATERDLRKAVDKISDMVTRREIENAASRDFDRSEVDKMLDDWGRSLSDAQAAFNGFYKSAKRDLDWAVNHIVAAVAGYGQENDALYYKKDSGRTGSSNILRSLPSERDWKRAVLKKFRVKERDIAPAGEHSHTMNYKPVFNVSKDKVEARFSTGDTVIRNGGDYWYDYTALADKNKGNMVVVSKYKQTNTHENEIVSSRFYIDYEKFNTWEEALERLFKYFNIKI